VFHDAFQHDGVVDLLFGNLHKSVDIQGFVGRGYFGGTLLLCFLVGVFTPDDGECRDANEDKNERVSFHGVIDLMLFSYSGKKAYSNKSGNSRE